MKIIPLVVGSFGAIHKQFGNRLKQIGITVGTAQVQKKFYLEQLEYWERFLKFEATGCGSILTVFSSTVLLCVSYNNINNNNNNCNNKNNKYNVD